MISSALDVQALLALPRDADAAAGLLHAPEELDLRGGPRRPRRGPNTAARRWSRRASRSRRSPTASTRPSTPRFADSFSGLLRAGAVRSPYEPAGSSNLEGLLGTGTYLVTPSTTPRALLTAMVARFKPRRPLRRAAGLQQPSRPGLLPADHGGVSGREGGLPGQEHAPGGDRDLQPPGEGHAAADGLHGPLRARPGRRHGHGPGPQVPVALQLLPAHGPAADADLRDARARRSRP